MVCVCVCVCVCVFVRACTLHRTNLENLETHVHRADVCIICISFGFALSNVQDTYAM